MVTQQFSTTDNIVKTYNWTKEKFQYSLYIFKN